MDFYQPIYQNCPHLFIDISLLDPWWELDSGTSFLEIAWGSCKGLLSSKHVLEYLLSILTHGLRILNVFPVQGDYFLLYKIRNCLGPKSLKYLLLCKSSVVLRSPSNNRCNCGDWGLLFRTDDHRYFLLRNCSLSTFRNHSLNVFHLIVIIRYHDFSGSLISSGLNAAMYLRKIHKKRAGEVGQRVRHHAFSSTFCLGSKPRPAPAFLTSPYPSLLGHDEFTREWWAHVMGISIVFSIWFWAKAVIAGRCCGLCIVSSAYLGLYPEDLGLLMLGCIGVNGLLWICIVWLLLDVWKVPSKGSHMVICFVDEWVAFIKSIVVIGSPLLDDLGLVGSPLSVFRVVGVGWLEVGVESGSGSVLVVERHGRVMDLNKYEEDEYYIWINLFSIQISSFLTITTY